jgi:Tfp pilus assembly protein PilW
MRDVLYWLLTLILLSAIASVYWNNRATTYRTADGACQSLTVEDECD